MYLLILNEFFILMTYREERLEVPMHTKNVINS